MADTVIIRTNIPEFKRQLDALGQDMEKKIVRSAVNAAATAFRKAIVVTVPVLKKPRGGRVAGTLKRAIYTYRVRRPEPGTIAMKVSFRKGKAEQKNGRDAFYGRFLEQGWIPRGPGKALKGGKRTKALQRERNLAAGAVKHSYPFIAPAFNRARIAALEAFTSKITDRIEKANNEKKGATS